MWLIIVGACVGAIVALTIVEILGSYWKEIGAEGWRGRFASVAGIFWFPKGYPFPVILLVALATISIAMWSIERSNFK